MALLFLLTTVLTKSGQINVNPAGGGRGGGVWARGGDLTNFKFFRSNSPGSETEGQSKVSKKSHARGKNLNKQYYDTI